MNQALKTFGVSSTVQAQDPDRFLHEVISEMRSRWGRGDHVSADDYFRRQPDLTLRPDVAEGLIAEEYRLRDEDPAASPLPGHDPRNRLERAQRLEDHFPAWSDFSNQRMPERRNPDGRVPWVKEYQIRQGEGPVVRLRLVFDPARSHRPVTYSEHPWNRPRHFVRLSRPGITGWSAQAALGVTVRDILDRREPGQHLGSGRELLAQGDETRAGGTLTRGRFFLTRADAERAVAWLGAQLAYELGELHCRGALHLNLHPQSILLTDEFDAATSYAHYVTAEAARDGLPFSPGSALLYAAPEVLDALEAEENESACLTTVDHRADIYSLGMVLLELLGRLGHRLHRVLGRCLDPDPRHRYPDMSSLAREFHRIAMAT